MMRKNCEGKRLVKYFMESDILHYYLGGFELNGIWVRVLPGPMHLDLKTGPLCTMFCTKLEEPCSFSKVPDGPYT